MNQNLKLNDRFICYSPYLNLKTPSNEYWSNLSRKFKKNLRRGSKLIEKNHGMLELKKFNKEKTIEKNFNNFWDLIDKKLRFKNLAPMPQQNKSFYEEVFIKFSRENWANLSFLQCDGLNISGVLGFEYDNKYYYYQTAFDHNYSKYGIGMIHIKCLLERFKKQGFQGI